MRRRFLALAAAAALVAATAGCGVSPFPVEPTLPGDVKHVVDNRSAFAASSSPLLGVAPGTVIDPLGDLSGCWGAYLPSPVIVGGEPVVELFYVFTFDAAQSRLTSYTYERDAFKAFPFLGAGGGQYTVTDASTIEWREDQSLFSDPRSGQLVDLGAQLGTPFSPTTAKMVLIRQGDSLKVWLPDDDGGYLGEADATILTRFDCQP